MKRLQFSVTNNILLKTSDIYDKGLEFITNNPSFHMYAVLSFPQKYITDYSIDGEEVKFWISDGFVSWQHEFKQVEASEYDELKFTGELNNSRTKLFIGGKVKVCGKELELETETIDANDVWQSTAKFFNFNIEYIGQSFGKAGERNALARDRAHATIQKILSQNMDSDEPRAIRILMFNTEYIKIDNKFVFDDGQVVEDPHFISITDAAESKKSEGKYLNLFEAFLINYFKPKYNVDFVNGQVPSNEHDSYKIVIDEQYDDFSFNAHYYVEKGYDKIVSFSTNEKLISFTNGILDELICVDFKTANEIDPEKYFYSFFDYGDSQVDN